MSNTGNTQDRLRALIQQWRAEGAQIDTFHATMGSGWKACADDLEAALAAVPPQSDTIRELCWLLREWQGAGDGVWYAGTDLYWHTDAAIAKAEARATPEPEDPPT